MRVCYFGHFDCILIYKLFGHFFLAETSYEISIPKFLFLIKLLARRPAPGLTPETISS